MQAGSRRDASCAKDRAWLCGGKTAFEKGSKPDSSPAVGCIVGEVAVRYSGGAARESTCKKGGRKVEAVMAGQSVYDVDAAFVGREAAAADRGTD